MRACLAAFVLCIAGPGWAQDAPDPAAAPPGALACSGCHGAGSGMTLDGLSADQIEAAMLGFRDGSRPATLMDRLATGFEPGEIAAIAAWIAGQEDGK